MRWKYYIIELFCIFFSSTNYASKNSSAIIQFLAVPKRFEIKTNVGILQNMYKKEYYSFIKFLWKLFFKFIDGNIFSNYWKSLKLLSMLYLRYMKCIPTLKWLYNSSSRILNSRERILLNNFQHLKIFLLFFIDYKKTCQHWILLLLFFFNLSIWTTIQQNTEPLCESVKLTSNIRS